MHGLLKQEHRGRELEGGGGQNTVIKLQMCPRRHDRTSCSRSALTADKKETAERLRLKPLPSAETQNPRPFLLLSSFIQFCQVDAKK